MGVLPDWMIESQVKIDPFVKDQVSKGVISYGLSSYGYDIRCAYTFKVFTNVHGSVVDPKNFDPKSFVDVELDPDFSDRYILIPPNSFALAESIEHVEIPRDMLALVIGKSTYARCGIVLNCTPLEPEWRGKITLEISNTTPLPAKIYAGEGIGQMMFFRSDGLRHHMEQELLSVYRDTNFSAYNNLAYDHFDVRTCRTSYADKRGKYQDQTGLVLPKVTSQEGE